MIYKLTPQVSSRGNIPTISDQIYRPRRIRPSLQVKQLLVCGKLTSFNNNELPKVCEDFLVDESARKSVVQHQEFRASKTRETAAERNTLPHIDWNDEYQVNSLKAN